MAFLISRKPPSSSSTTLSSSYEEDHSRLPATIAVTSFLYIRPAVADAAHVGGVARPSLDRDVVLRRIRHRKRANRMRSLLQSLLRVSPEKGSVDPADGWLEDAFSSP